MPFFDRSLPDNCTCQSIETMLCPHFILVGGQQQFFANDYRRRSALGNCHLPQHVLVRPDNGRNRLPDLFFNVLDIMSQMLTDVAAERSASILSVELLRIRTARGSCSKRTLSRQRATGNCRAEFWRTFEIPYAICHNPTAVRTSSQNAGRRLQHGHRDEWKRRTHPADDC